MKLNFSVILNFVLLLVLASIPTFASNTDAVPNTVYSQYDDSGGMIVENFTIQTEFNYYFCPKEIVPVDEGMKYIPHLNTLTFKPYDLYVDNRPQNQTIRFCFSQYNQHDEFRNPPLSYALGGLTLEGL